LADQFSHTDIAFVAPQAASFTWYPYSFLAPIAQNEPWLGSALQVVAGLVEAFEQQAVPSERLAVMGFSEGACLSLEFAARHARRYAAVVAFTGGLIGPPGTPQDYAGNFAGTPVFIGSSDVDPHVPLERVRESTSVLRGMGAIVDERIYPGLGHTINVDELQAVDALLRPR
jgi:predicted esterase